ncbi:MAG TPA: DNA polymerase [Isosphaeraceae bacterium]|nr:DNA polymerase [Isosphaeraceae bacterium]
MTRVVHDPRECREALARTTAPVILDLETTGLRHWDQVVSAGLLIDDVAYLLFVRTLHPSITNVSETEFHAALEPLSRPDLVVVGHNLPFDLAFLRRDGVAVAGECRDTLKILRLLDQDRGAGSQGRARLDLRAPAGAEVLLNYRLKDVARQLLGLRMPYFPGTIERVPYAAHRTYLACDLLGTRALYDHLWPRLGRVGQRYYREIVAPLIPVLLAMTEVGVAADADFIRAESDQLGQLMERLSVEHRRTHGVALGLDQAQMRRWLFKTLGLPVLKQGRRGTQWVPSLDAEALRRLEAFNEDPHTAGSLRLIRDYRKAAGLLVRLRSLLNHIDLRTGRIHSSFDDRQATGRLSSTYPNLQQLARKRELAKTEDDPGMEFHSRNALVASPGYELAVFDIAQADIRVLASAVENFPVSAKKHLANLRKRRLARLGPTIQKLCQGLDKHRNPSFRPQTRGRSGGGVESFQPPKVCELAEDFRTPGDFYAKAVERILDRPPRDKAERDWFKPIILAIVNGKGANSLARDLDCSVEEAKAYLDKFNAAYPEVAAYKAMIYDQIALTGRTRTFMGRTRTVTAHRWMVARKKVRILVTYKGGDRYWLEIIPVEPRLRVLTSYVLRAWDAKTKRLIYDHKQGRLTQHPYRLFDQHGLQYRLPVRNWGWRSIRRVRSGGQEARYEGFDATARAAFNFICQAGTADVAKLMMLRAGPLCEQYGARLLIQIHDELVFEVPQEHAERFLTKMRRELERPPTPEFRVPIVVEAKRGVRFGDLAVFPAPRKPGCWFTGLRAWLGRLVARARRLVVRVWSVLRPGAPASL